MSRRSAADRGENVTYKEERLLAIDASESPRCNFDWPVSVELKSAVSGHAADSEIVPNVEPPIDPLPQSMRHMLTLRIVSFFASVKERRKSDQTLKSLSISISLSNRRSSSMLESTYVWRLGLGPTSWGIRLVSGRSFYHTVRRKADRRTHCDSDGVQGTTFIFWMIIFGSKNFRIAKKYHNHTPAEGATVKDTIRATGCHPRVRPIFSSVKSKKTLKRLPYISE